MTNSHGDINSFILAQNGRYDYDGMREFPANSSGYGNSNVDSAMFLFSTTMLIFILLFTFLSLAITIWTMYSVHKTIPNSQMATKVGWLFTAFLASGLFYIPIIVWFVWAKKEYSIDSHKNSNLNHGRSEYHANSHNGYNYATNNLHEKYEENNSYQSNPYPQSSGYERDIEKTED